MILDEYGRPFTVPPTPFAAAMDAAVRSMTRESIERTFSFDNPARMISPIVDERGNAIFTSIAKIGTTFQFKIPARFSAK